MTPDHTKLAWLLLFASAILSGCVTPRKPVPSGPPAPRYEKVTWSQVEGWSVDQPQEAWSAFMASCKARGTRPEWKSVCTAASSQSVTDAVSARRFFETYFAPYRVLQTEGKSVTDSGTVTGYFEPLLRGSRKSSPPFTVPLYAPPPDMLTIRARISPSPVSDW